jgi:hypothetical protein
MKKETKSQLDVLMDKYGQRLEEAKKRQEQIKSEEDVFLSEFKRLRKEVIFPEMEDIGNHLKVRGHDYRIAEEEESLDSEGRTRDAKITINIFPAGVDRSAYRPEDTPSISFIATRYEKKIWVHGSNMMPNRGGSAGSRGKFNVEEITSDIVEREVLKVLKEIYDPK